MPHVDIIIDGKKCPSVTEIVGLISKPYLDTWKRKIGFEEADKIMNEASGLGRVMHSHVENYLRGHSIQFCGSPIEEKIFKSWRDWWEGSTYKHIELEKLVISKKKKFGGTFDALVQDNAAGYKKSIVDWKFSKSDDPLRILQLAGYAYAYWEETGEKINSGLIIRVNPQTGNLAKTVEYKNLWKWTKVFLVLRRVYDLAKGKIKL